MQTNDWRPVASRQALEARAELNASIRAFFTERKVLEVETPILAQAGVTDVHLVNVATQIQGLGQADPRTYYLQTSPEYAMKRLLAANIGDCFQLARVVRNEEVSRRHNIEFTLLEWYRLGFDDTALMDELEALLQHLLGTERAQRLTYQNAFLQIMNVDPLSCSAEALAKRLRSHGIDADVVAGDKQALLHLAMSTVVEPSLPANVPTFITHFPAEQAALARLSENDPRVAHRFELFYRGLELANGFWELSDPEQQRLRFLADNRERKRLGLPEVSIDERFLSALASGLPDCAGVAVGVDRLLMIQQNVDDIKQVLNFPSEYA